MKVSSLQRKVFEKFITDDFLHNIILYMLFRDSRYESIEALINDFLDKLLEIHRNIKYTQLQETIGNINEENVNKVIESDILYHKLRYTKEFVNAIIINGDLFKDIQEDDEIFTTVYDKVITIEDFVNKLKRSVAKRKVDVNKTLNKILEIINLFDEVEKLSDIARDYEKLLETITTEKTTSTYSVINHFKTVIQNAYLRIVESKIKEKGDDLLSKHSIIEFGSSSIPQLITDYVINQYDVLHTGLEFIDNYIDGFEAGNVYLICAPSNHGKTILLINIAYNIIKKNIEKFEKNDVILFVTLEDNKIKLSRRIFSIFGNYPTHLVRRLYKVIKQTKEYEKACEIFTEMEKQSIKNVTQDKVIFMIQDQADNNYTTADLVEVLTTLKLKNYKVRAIIIDYVDLMTSTKGYEKDYDEHGQIIKDLRVIAKEYQIPIITATQLKREAEDTKIKLSNNLKGDSHKKVRFSDYILMIRQLQEVPSIFFAESFPIHQMISNELLAQSIIQNITPVEYVYTKMKDTDKRPPSNDQIISFYRTNLRFYDSPKSLLNDLGQINERTTYLENVIKELSNHHFEDNSRSFVDIFIEK